MPGNHWSVYPSPFDLQNSSTIVWEWIWTSKAIHILEENSSDLTTKVLGLDIAKGQVQEIILRWVDIDQVPGLAVPGGTWFTRVVQTGANNSAYSLFRWTVAKVFSLKISCSVVLWLPVLTNETSKPENWASFSLETGDEIRDVQKFDF